MSSILFDDLNDQEFDNINEDSVEGLQLRTQGYADRNNDFGKAIRKVDLLNNKLKRGEISKEEFDKKFKEVKSNYGDLLSSKHSKDLLNTGGRSEEESKDSRQSKEEITGGKVEHYYRNDNMNDTNKKKVERYADIMASTDNYNDYKEAHKNLAKLLNADKKSTFEIDSQDNVRTYAPGEEDIEKDSNTKLYHTSKVNNIDKLNPTYKSTDGKYYPNKRVYVGKDEVMSRIAGSKSPEDYKPDGETHAYEVENPSKYKIHSDNEMQGSKARYIETDNKVPVKKFKESGGVMSILFDDLNDQEFQEALDIIYQNESESKVTNLFEQSFESRLESNKSLINEDTEYFLLEEEIKRSELPDSIFGVPEQRKYPLDSEKHVRSAIKLFNYVDPKYEAGLAKKIKRKMKEYNITDINVGAANRFSKYYHPSKKAVNEADESIELPNSEKNKIENIIKKYIEANCKDLGNDIKCKRVGDLTLNISSPSTKNIKELMKSFYDNIGKNDDENSPVVKDYYKICDKYSIFLDYGDLDGNIKINITGMQNESSTGWLVLNPSGKWTLADNYEDYEKYYNPSKLNESYYTKKDILLEELGEFLLESEDKIKYIEKDSKVIKMPKVCPKCGSKMGIFIQGEPVCLCTNKDCKYYAGTVCFDQKAAAKKFNEFAVLSEAEDNTEDEVKDKVKGKPSPISSEAVKKALESAAEIPDPKKRSAKIRGIISSTVGKLSAKIKHVFGNLKLYDNEYTYDGYIREVFPKYLDMLNAKDMYKLKQSIMEHAFTTGSGHKSLSDVMRTNQMNTDKDNYLYNLADKVRKDLSVFLHALDAKYEKARFDGSTPYKKEEEKEVDTTPVKISKGKNDENEEETPKKEEPKKKRRSYWDVDVSEEEEEELDESFNEDLKNHDKRMSDIRNEYDDKTKKLMDSSSTVDEFKKQSNKDLEDFLKKLEEDKKRLFGDKASNKEKSTNESAEVLTEGLFSKMKDKKLVKTHTKDIDKAYEYINSKLKSYSFYYPFPKDKLLPSVRNGYVEFVAGYIDLPKLYKSVYGPTLNKVIESQQPATKVKERLDSFDAMMDALSTDGIKAYFDYIHPETFYIDNKEGDFQADMYDFSSAPQSVVKIKTSAVKESAELLEEKAKIKSDDPDDAGYYETNIKIKGAKVVVCSRYHEEAEAQIKSMGKAFKNVEKSYPNVLESVANEIYNEWSKDHGEKLSRKDFTREIYKSKLQNRVIAYKDDYGFVFEFNYSINPVLGGKLLNISIYTDLDGLVSSYKYELESTVRKY